MQYFTAMQMSFARPAIALAMLVAPQLTTPAAAEQAKKIKVYILAGQSNMVGIGQVTGGDSRWGKEFTNTALSIYEGTPDAKTDYDKLQPVKTIPLAEFGGTNSVNPKPFPNEGVVVLRGQITMPATGVYEFYSGYGASEQNIMVVDGTAGHRGTGLPNFRRYGFSPGIGSLRCEPEAPSFTACKQIPLARSPIRALASRSRPTPKTNFMSMKGETIALTLTGS